MHHGAAPHDNKIEDLIAKMQFALFIQIYLQEVFYWKQEFGFYLYTVWVIIIIIMFFLQKTVWAGETRAGRKGKQKRRGDILLFQA